jgi:16S rRNA (adenine1518-N6/adenine1519-N6)-dimethyltransferase
MTADNKPKTAVLLVQKEVAERLAAKPGDMSILGISAQVYADVTLGNIIPAKLFTPPPKVNSQVVIFKSRQTPFFEKVDETDFFRIVKAGFSAKRKMIRSSLSGGLKMSKLDIEKYLIKAGINPNDRAENLSLDDWLKITSTIVHGINH